MLPGTPQKSTLIRRPAYAMEWVSNCETDVRTALSRGLAEYLEGLTTNLFPGVETKLNKVYQHHAESEEDAVYPSAVVQTEGEGPYQGEGTGMKPSMNANDVTATGDFIVKCGEFVTRATVEVSGADADQRMRLVKMIEDGASPVDWMGGFRLRLPHYYGAIAQYDLQSNQYNDDDESASRGLWRALFVFQAQVAVIRVQPKGLPFQPRTKSTIT